MRRATHDVAFLIHEDGTLGGFTLGFDFCAEHEFGVKTMKRALGISGGLGVEGRTMTQQPATVQFDTYKRTQRKQRGTRKAPAKDPAAVLMVHAHADRSDPGQSIKDRVRFMCRDGLDFHAEPHDTYYNAERDTVAAAWDENGFAIHVRGSENVQRLEELAEAIKRNDMALADPGGMGFADRRGLGVIIASRIPEAMRAKTLADDEDYQRMLSTAEATGIEQLLKDAGKRFYALSPRWADDTKQDVRFWLNPAEQHTYKSGWFTVEELKQWAKDEGPILKANDAAKPRNPGP